TDGHTNQQRCAEGWGEATKRGVHRNVPGPGTIPGVSSLILKTDSQAVIYSPLPSGSPNATLVAHTWRFGSPPATGRLMEPRILPVGAVPRTARGAAPLVDYMSPWVSIFIPSPIPPAAASRSPSFLMVSWGRPSNRRSLLPAVR